MNDRELCEVLGTTPGEAEADAEKYEAGDLSGMKSGSPIDVSPQEEQEGMRDEYDFSESEPNPYCGQVRRQQVGAGRAER